MYLDAVEYKGEIHSWERDKDGVLSHSVVDSSDYTYLFMRDNTESGTYVDIYGNQMKKVSFDNKQERDSFAKEREGIVTETDVQPVYRFLLDNHLDADTTAPYNIAYFDIEVDFDLEDGLGFPNPKNPFGEINSISVFDTCFNSFIMFIPEINRGKVSLTDDHHHVEIIWTMNERDMLKKFAEYLEHVDIITGWNSESYDVPYIIERTKKLFGDKKSLTMFSRDGLPAQRRDFINDYKEEVWSWRLPGRIHLDMMLLFKKFQPGEHKSFKLDSICEEVLGENKVEFDDDLGSLYRENPQRFFEYSLHDSRLLLMLDTKQKVIDLAMLMTRSMCALSKDVTASVNIIEMALMKFCRKKGNIVLPDKPNTPKEKFPGAIVYDTIPGRHGWVFTADLTALYPSAIIMLGLSTETLVGQCRRGYEDYIKVMTGENTRVIVDMVDGSEIELTGRELLDTIRSEGLTISGNATLFNGKLGLLAEFTEEGFNQRSMYKKMMKESSDEDERTKFDLYQKVMKLRNNSIYGVTSQPSFRMYDIRMASSTTLTGQIISKWQAYKTNKLVNQLEAE